jgi:quinolinate synthase
VIAFCGVHFMAETAKILNPDKVVVVPDLTAGCSLADGCPAPAFARWLERYPGHTVVSYINCSADVKAMSDVICTSSNAVKIVKALAGERIVFAPDRHLGAFVAKQAERPDLVLWQGTCVVHETFSERRLLELMAQHPGAEVIAHPECHEGILRHAAYVASTSGLITYAAKSAKQTFIVATEAGILHKMQAAAPGKTLIAAPPDDESCACNVCPHMRKNTLAKLYLCLRDLAPQVDVPEATRVKALRPIQRMLEMSA